MPIYEYSCADCDKIFEVIQKFSDDPIKECAHCSGTKVAKLISQSSFVLKGGGWYQDGYSSTKPNGKPSSKPSSTEEKSSAPKPDCSSCPSSNSN